MAKTQSEMIENLELGIRIKEDIKKIQEYINQINLRNMENPESLFSDAITVGASKNIFEVLIAAFKRDDISLDIPNKYGMTALDSAFVDNHFDGIEALIMGGANYKRVIPGRHMTHLDFYTTHNPTMQDKINVVIERRKKADQQEANSSSISALWSEIVSCFYTPTKAKYVPLSTAAAKDDAEIENMPAASAAAATKTAVDLKQSHDNSKKPMSLNKKGADHHTDQYGAKPTVGSNGSRGIQIGQINIAAGLAKSKSSAK